MLVAYNGGKVVDTTTNEVLYDKYIPDDLAMELLEHLKDYPVNPIIDDGKFFMSQTRMDIASKKRH